jgi:hypothetical protein
MQALKGIIIRCRADEAEVELESGTVLKVRGDSKFSLGSRVQVLYDFTRMKVRRVILENEWFPGDEATPPDEEPEHEGIEDPTLLEYYAEVAEDVWGVCPR